MTRFAVPALQVHYLGEANVTDLVRWDLGDKPVVTWGGALASVCLLVCVCVCVCVCVSVCMCPIRLTQMSSSVTT
jgi:hypothetical protein